LKIARVEAWTVAIPFRNPILSAYGVSYPARLRSILQLITDDGLTGIGETGPSALTRIGHHDMSAHLLDQMRSFVEGRDPFHFEDILRDLGYSADSVAIEMACLDIIGKATGRRVAELLGGCDPPSSLPISGYSFLRLPDREGKGAVTEQSWVESTVRQVEQYGFSTIKLKLGVCRPELEIDISRELRTRLPRTAIRVDPNGAWTVATAVRVMRRLEELDLEYVEDPVKDSPLGLAQDILSGRSVDVAGLRRLRMSSRVPLCADNCYRLDLLRELIRSDAVDVVLGDVFGCGGLRRTIRWFEAAQLFHLGTGMHSGTEIGIGQAAKLHVTAALGGLDHPMDAIYPEYVDDVLAGGPLRIGNGRMDLPRGPGLGVELDPEKLEKWSLTPERHRELDAWWDELKQEAGATRRASSLLVRSF
jgi:glucarate dehydratase